MKRITLISLFAGAAVLLMMAGGCGTTQSSAASSQEETTESPDPLFPGKSAAVGHIEVSDIDRAGYTTFEEYVVSHTAGVDLDENGRLVIRGMSTDRGYTPPLILLDGVEVLDTSTINPFDIASIDVIKDGTASIYGMRGTGGVILVTSKAKADRNKKKK